MRHHRTAVFIIRQSQRPNYAQIRLSPHLFESRILAFPARATSKRFLPWLVAIAWLAFLAAIAILKPGELLELVVLSAAGSVAWYVASRGSGVAAIVAMVLFAVPLIDTWPARVLQLAPDRLPVPLPAFLSVVSLLAALAIIAVRPNLRSLPIPLLVLGTPLLLAGALSAIAAQNHRDALGQAWLGFAVPIGLGLLVASRRPTWTTATTLLLGLATPAIVGIAAYMLSFGVPLSGADLVRAKVELYRPHLFQELTYGNVGHIADLALMMLPLAVLAPVAWWRDRLMRIVSMAVALVILIVIVLVLSRSTLVVALLMLAGVASLLAIRGQWGAVAPAAGVAIIIFILVLPDVRGLYGGILPTAGVALEHVAQSPSPYAQATPTNTPVTTTPVPSASPVASATPKPTAGPVTVVGSASDTSTSDRIGAIRQAISIAARHALLGVGTGQYARLDPAQTAPHSLLVLLVVENGVLGGLGLVLLLAVLSARLLRLAWSGDMDNGALLQVGALAGAFGFIVKGIVAGVPLVLGTIDVWAASLWALVAIGMASPDPTPYSGRVPLLPVKRVAALAIAFGLLLAVGIARFPLALEPGSADRNGVTLNSLVDSGDLSGPNDWYSAALNLDVKASRQRMELLLTQPADAQALVLSRPIAVFPSSCYDLSVSEISSTTPLVIVLADEEGRPLGQMMRLPAGESGDVHFRIMSGNRFRVSILFTAPGPIAVDIGTVRMSRLTSCP